MSVCVCPWVGDVLMQNAGAADSGATPPLCDTEAGEYVEARMFGVKTFVWSLKGDTKYKDVRTYHTTKVGPGSGECCGGSLVAHLLLSLCSLLWLYTAAVCDSSLLACARRLPAGVVAARAAL